MISLNTKGIDAVLQSYSKDGFKYRLLEAEDLNQDYFDLLGQLTKTGDFDAQKVQEFYEKNLKNNQNFFLIIVEVASRLLLGCKR